jgi:formylmethanofuran dehydrogenase subunit E
LEIGFEDIRKYHGGLALMAVAVGFRSLQAAFAELFGDEIPQRKSISILSGHAGPGFRDAFEYVTRAVTRGAYQVNVEYPQAQYDPHRAQSYAFVISSADGAAVEVALKKDFLPMKFYDFLAKGREGSMTEEEEEEFRELKWSLSQRALALPQEELLSVKRIS